MTESATETNPAALDRLLGALRAGATESAEQVLASARPRIGGGTLRRAGEMLMRRRQWAQAAWVFERAAAGEPDAACDLKRRLSLNLACLQAHRPALYTLLTTLPAAGGFRIGATPSGQPTVQYADGDGQWVSLSPGPEPLAAAAASLPKIYAPTKTGEAVALCGLGDGYLAQLLAQRPQSLFMDKAQPVYLIEPEPQVVLHCLMVHDFTGPAGPIEAARFQWFVGSEWAEAFDAAVLDDAMLPCPLLMVGQGPFAQSVQARLRETLAKISGRDKHLAAEVARLYATPDPAALAPLFGDHPPRKPRVLLLTTRFSTVLQYSTRDTAAAFERLGWEARVMIEPTPHHRMLRTAIAKELAGFRPDLVFQIDHLRHEHDGLFPPGLPFACWIQDHLPHLATREAGGSVGPMDFVLTDATATYVDKFAYPARQCVSLPKLTRADGHPAPGARGRGIVTRPRDVTFVSNASHTAEAMLAQGLALFATTDAARELITACCERIERTYADGGSLPAYADVCAALRAELAHHGTSLPGEDFDRLARWLTHPFNDAVYRQQALRWAARAAQSLGLSLALYGSGWEKHPEFARYARGPVAYGDELAAVTRESPINLQIVPYLCLHQRLLDGLMAGGFFLVRRHPSDVAPARLLNFVHRNARAARTAPAVAASLPPQFHPEFGALLDACRPCLCTTGGEDVVAMVRDWEEAGQLVAGQGTLPMLDEISFEDEAGLRDRLERFAGAAALRETVIAAQRQSVVERLTYDAGVRRVVRRIGVLLAETAEATAAPSVPAAPPVAAPRQGAGVPTGRWLKPAAKAAGGVRAA